MPQKLFVGNLPHEVTDSELGEFVSSAGFQAASAMVIRDKTTGQSRGFGFIELAEGEDLERAIAGLNGQSLQGRRLTVNEARPPRNDFGGGGGRRPGGGGGGGRGPGRGTFRWRAAGAGAAVAATGRIDDFRFDDPSRVSGLRWLGLNSGPVRHPTYDQIICCSWDQESSRSGTKIVTPSPTKRR
jgi:cold-inducible RNA-binding protein